jgi:CheY-like chemotaxis protein
VAVKDSGAGLSPEQLAEICAEGVQFNANQLQAGQGSGLGLFISKGLVEQHGGTLRVSSEGLGRGSTFTIELPVFRAEADIVPTRRRSGEARQKERRSSKSSGAGSSRLQATQDGNHLTDDLFCIPESVLDLAENTEIIRRVLVVDDADSNRKLVMRILAAKGYLCTGAANGQEAVDAYAQLKQQGEHVDAVMMDYEMPIMDGPTACKKLREMGCTCFIAGVTGNVLPADVDHFKHMGASAVLSKPLNVDVFESLYHSFTAPAPPLATNATRSLSEARTIELMVASTSNGGSDGSMNNHLHGLDIV